VATIGSLWCRGGDLRGPEREQDGIWARVEHRLQADADATGDLNWRAQADATIMPAHQNAAGAHEAG
jgi:hypothetical protein